MERLIPPQCAESEMAILGAIFLHNAAIDEAHAILAPDDFYRESHRRIYHAMAGLADRNEPIDLVTMSRKLKDEGDLEMIGGGAYLATLVEYTPTAANIAHYCKVVARKAFERRLILYAHESLKCAYEGDIEGALSKLEAATNVNPRQSSEPVGMMQNLRETMKGIERRYENKGQISGISYGLPSLDKLTNGLQHGELIIVAGRPSMGKSAFAGNILASACEAGKSGLLFTLEMSRSRVMERFLAARNIKYHHIRSGQLRDNDWQRLSKAADDLHQWPLAIDDTPGISLQDVRAKARRQKKKGLDLLVVDYLQLMGTPPGADRNRAIGDISRGLKNLAKELDIPVVALSQLSRAVDSRQDKRPVMSDLRDSGEVEQDADVILFPFREAAYCQLCRDRVDNDRHNYKEHQSKAEIILEKQRDGERNISVPACWLGEHQKFVEMEEY